MKILRSKMYDREAKDCEINIRFTDKEMNDFVKDSGFIQEDYICMTNFGSLKYLDNMACVIYVGMEHNKEYKLGFYIEHKWDIKEDRKYYKIDLENHHKTYIYNDNITLSTLQKRFILDVIRDGYLKY